MSHHLWITCQVFTHNKHYLQPLAKSKIIIPTLQMRKMKLQRVSLLEVTYPLEGSAGIKSHPV